MKNRTIGTAWGALLPPAGRPLEMVRVRVQRVRVLTMAGFTAPDVLRHVQGWQALWEQLNAGLHLAATGVERPH